MLEKTFQFQYGLHIKIFAHKCQFEIQFFSNMLILQRALHFLILMKFFVKPDFYSKLYLFKG